MAGGWSSAFLIAANADSPQLLWLIPALAIGAGAGLCLRYLSGPKVALLLALCAAGGMGIVNSFFPDSRVRFDSVQGLIDGTSLQNHSLMVSVDKRWTTPPFDKPFYLSTPVSLDLSLYSRMPSGIDDICFSPAGELFASLPALSAVYRFVPSAGDLTTDRPELFLHGLDNPTGLACDAEELFVAEATRVRSFSYAGKDIGVLFDGLPDDGGHQQYRLLKYRQGYLLSIGSRCDACPEDNPLRATVQAVSSQGKQTEFARGLRFVGGMAADQQHGTLWVTEQSRQYPAPGAGDELNELTEGADFGWPSCDTVEGASVDQPGCRDKQTAAVLFHSRANPGDLLTTGEIVFPLVYRSSLLVVLLGDAENKVLPAVVRIQLSDGTVGSPAAFLGGWDGVTSRPGAIRRGPDNVIYIADAINGAIYRVAWRGGGK